MLAEFFRYIICFKHVAQGSLESTRILGKRCHPKPYSIPTPENRKRRFDLHLSARSTMDPSVSEYQSRPRPDPLSYILAQGTL